MPVLFERFVVKVEPGPDGVLRPCPGATPRWEPAVREGTVHRQLSALVDATPAQIAAFASSHGLLRRGAVDRQFEPEGASLALFAGQANFTPHGAGKLARD